MFTFSSGLTAAEDWRNRFCI